MRSSIITHKRVCARTLVAATVFLAGCQQQGVRDDPSGSAGLGSVVGGGWDWVKETAGSLTETPPAPTSAEERLGKSYQSYLQSLAIRASLEKGLLTGLFVYGICKLGGGKSECEKQAVAVGAIATIAGYLQARQTIARERNISEQEVMVEDIREEVAALRQTVSDAQAVAAQNDREIAKLAAARATGQAFTAAQQEELARIKANNEVVGSMARQGRKDLKDWEQVNARNKNAGNANPELEKEVANRREVVEKLEATHTRMQDRFKASRIA